MVIERFAPSPTGLLHLGHAFSAATACAGAREAGGQFLLRMEDLDASRVRAEYIEAIKTDLIWLGLKWDGPILFQSTRGAAYKDALSALGARGLTYRCACTRRDIAAAASAPQEGVATVGIDGAIYPGTCRGRSVPSDAVTATRLDMARALAAIGSRADRIGFRELSYDTAGAARWVPLDPDQLMREAGDVVLSRRDGTVAYHLAVVVDDAHQGISHVTRGEDLYAATQIHCLLQALLDLPTPVYRHHRLIRDDAGKRLAKRDDARAIATMRAAGDSARAVLARVGITLPGGPEGAR